MLYVLRFILIVVYSVVSLGDHFIFRYNLSPNVIDLIMP